MLEINKIYKMDCLEGMKMLDDNSIDSIVTDPPAGISFMGKEWDSDKGGRDKWIRWMTEVMQECFRVLKPGAHALVWSLPRTSHWMATAMEDAEFEIRDCIYHLFGSGFPKNMDISKAIDKSAGKVQKGIQRLKDELKRVFDLSGLTLNELNKKCGFEASGYFRKSSTWTMVLPTPEKWWKMREVLGCDDDFSFEFKEAERCVIGKKTYTNSKQHMSSLNSGYDSKRVCLNITTPATEAAKQWSGWGTALKPAAECWWLCRKPIEGTIAQNVLKWDTGGINIDKCRIGTEIVGWSGRESKGLNHLDSDKNGNARPVEGRWPANVILDESAAEILDKQSGTLKSGNNCIRTKEGNFLEHGGMGKAGDVQITYGDFGGASRFFYCAKANQGERNFGCEDMADREIYPQNNSLSRKETNADKDHKTKNFHPTVKPLKLIEYLITLVTPKGGVCLDPFEGSGTHQRACIALGFNYVGFEIDPQYFEIAEKRATNVQLRIV